MCDYFQIKQKPTSCHSTVKLVRVVADEDDVDEVRDFWQNIKLTLERSLEMANKGEFKRKIEE